MQLNTDLFLSILAMDAYNRGYDAGIDLSDPNNLANPSDADGTQIGDAKVIDASSSNPNSPEVAAGFYAIAYNTPFGQVISYRGTDDPSIFALDGSDIWHGWTFGAGFGTSQIDLAQACPHAFH